MWWLLAAIVLGWVVLWVRRYLGEQPRRVVETQETQAADPAVPPEIDDAVVGDELDLHGVPPAEVGGLVDAFVDVCVERGLASARIIHGKGIGVLRRTVRAHLARHPAVRWFGDAPPPSSWGATLFELSEPSSGSGSASQSPEAPAP